MQIEKEEVTTYYVTLDQHDYKAVQQMLKAWYDVALPQLEVKRPTVIEFGIMDAFKVEY